MGIQLKLGTAKVDITPVKPLPLAGFMHRIGDFASISLRLYARIFFFQTEDTLGETQKALFISADLIWWGSERIASLNDQIRKRWGIEKNSIILHATHTHSGPQT